MASCEYPDQILDVGHFVAAWLSIHREAQEYKNLKLFLGVCLDKIERQMTLISAINLFLQQRIPISFAAPY
jgi:hypothetical protein